MSKKSKLPVNATHDFSEILFAKETTFIGRNGMGRCKGIQVRMLQGQL